MKGRVQGIKVKYVWGLLLLIWCVYGSSISVDAAAIRKSTDGKWQYTILDEDSKTVEIVTAYTTAISNKDVVIPANIDGYKVLGIGESVFKGNRKITSVTLETGIEYIGTACFNSCYSITKIVFPNTLKRIGTDAFNSCSSLSKVSIPTSVTEINGGAFWYTPWLNNATGSG